MGLMEKREVVTVFLRHDNHILLLKRSDKSATYQGQWGGISGLLEVETPLMQACQEINEETGLDDGQYTLVSDGAILEVPAPELNTCWVIHPFLFDIIDPDLITLDESNESLQWVKAEEIHGIATVPALIKSLARCLERERNTRH